MMHECLQEANSKQWSSSRDIKNKVLIYNIYFNETRDSYDVFIYWEDIIN